MAKRILLNLTKDEVASYSNEKTTRKHAYEQGIGYDNDKVVPTTTFDPASLDSIWDMAQDSGDRDAFLDSYANYKAEKKLARMLVVIISMFHNEKRDVALNIDVVVEACGLPFNGKLSYRDIAEKHAISNEALSKRIEKLVNDLGIHPPSNLKRMMKGRKPIYGGGNHRNEKKIFED